MYELIRARIRERLVKTPFLWRLKGAFAPRFPGSAAYWNSRYLRGGTSGAGSSGQLARFKADFINAFVVTHSISSVIEFGCGDGRQLSLAHYPRYIGLDVSAAAVRQCIERFEGDRSKSFFLYDGACFADNHHLFRADLALSLDVVYHITEDHVFAMYMEQLFTASKRFVIIYSSNHDEVIANTHVRHRRFSEYASAHFPNYALVKHVPQPYPSATHGEDNGSFADFFVYEKLHDPLSSDPVHRLVDG